MPNIIPDYAQVHYRCTFDIYNDEQMEITRKLLLNWLRKHPNYMSSIYAPKGRDWFYKGSYNKQPDIYLKDTRAQIRTAVVFEEQNRNSPALWGFEYIHPDENPERPDSNVPGRWWSIEIALKKDEDHICFSSTTKYYWDYYYVGPDCESPSPTTPKYVKLILTDSRLTCKKGECVVLSKPSIIPIERDSGLILNLFSDIKSPNRKIPYIFVSGTFAEKNNLESFSKMILGNANIFVFKSEDACDEFNYYIGRSPAARTYHYRYNSVHYYLSGIDIKKISTRSHHYYNDTEYDGLQEYLVRAFARYSKNRLDDLFSFPDIISERRKLQLRERVTNLTHERQQLGEEVSKQQQDSEIILQLYDEEYVNFEKIKNNLQTKNRELQSDNKSLKEDNNNLTREKIANSRKIKKIENENKNLQEENKACRFAMQYCTFEQQLEVLKRFYSHKIVVLPNAFSSAKAFSKNHKDIDAEMLEASWDLLMSVVEMLYNICFSNKSDSIENAYNNCQSQFSLAMNEGKQTNANSKHKNQRLFSYKGCDEDFTPHIKYDRKGVYLRLHFYIDNEEEKIVIGHYGDHLDNAKTRKIK